MKHRFHYPSLQCLLWGIYGVGQTYLNPYCSKRGLTTRRSVSCSVFPRARRFWNCR